MPRGVKKSDLPEKTCVTCAKPMVWRKKWARDWDQVKYCSERCRLNKPDFQENPTAEPGKSR